MKSADGSAAVAAGKVLKGPRACATCAKAKSRCIAGPGGQEKCERCYRLRKPCSSQTPAPARKRKEPKPTRVAELERRLEDLTARIETVQRQGPAAPSPPDSDHYAIPSSLGAPADPDDPLPPRNLSGIQIPLPTFGQDRWNSPFGHLFPERSIFENPPEHQQPTPNGRVAPATSDASPLAASSGLTPNQTTASRSIGSSPYQQPGPQPSQQQGGCPWPQGDEAEAFLGVYRERMCHLFPFAIVPPHLSSAQMREQRPFFWKVIMMESCLFDGRRQVALGNELLREISEAAFLKPQKNLDLLQGLQMLIAWYHYNLNNFQMGNLLFLARSITTSLGTAEPKGVPGKEGYDAKCLEQMRAFVGTYYLVTIAFTTNKRPDALMNNVNTSYLATCCRALLSQMEYPTDELVVHLVRAQQLLQSISQGFARRKAVPNENRVPQAAFIQSMQERIRGFAAALPPHIRADPSLSGHFLVAEILVYENSLEELSHCPLAGPSGGEPTSMAALSAPVSEADAGRVSMLWECARAVHTFMSQRFSNEAQDFPRYICPTSLDLTYVFITMLKLVTLQVPGWDLARVREELQFDECMSRLMKRMEYMTEKRKRKRQGGVAVEGEEDEAEDPYAKLARKIRNVHGLLHVSGFDSDYATSQVAARVCAPAPMTLADATQDLMQDLGGGLWQDATSSVAEWDPFLVSEAIDWAAIFNNYVMAESLYAT
ncbi:hypothetical protein C8A01DRAFT_12582 [Parachaetomium inaequale]|uniref:Zn(2)-C6 fungal-type domain-containing protein n=1 Tax=Parachaetomium inaequale TaxID=2588326 RepID=A0AAN6SVX2_9PEZI|nr:hypothetical protein C8A01DRAFT_12582 [Parachaetomium inaequale]